MAGLTARQHSSESNKTAPLPGSCARVSAEPSSAGTRASKHQQHLPHGSSITRSCAQGSAWLPPALHSELHISCQGHLASKVCSYGPTAASAFQTRLLHNACLQLRSAEPASWRADRALAQHRAVLRAQSSPGLLRQRVLTRCRSRAGLCASSRCLQQPPGAGAAQRGLQGCCQGHVHTQLQQNRCHGSSSRLGCT